VAGILVWVAQEQDLLMGWLFLSVFALGMGQLFILLGTFSSMISKLPKSGPWMETVKVVFATIFVGMTIYYLRLVIPLFSDLSLSIWEATL
jgi:thiol:disulfide interchange protein DsbD